MNALLTASSLGAFEIGCLAVPYSINPTIALFTPLTNKVHEWALNTSGTYTPHFIQMLHLIAKPVDRLIQALVSPIFHLYIAYKFYMDGKDLNNSLLTALSIMVLPICLITGLAQSSFLLMNACSQLICPIQSIYAIIKGKEAAREYFDYRANTIKSIAKDHLSENNEYISALSEIKSFTPPKYSLDELKNGITLKKLDGISSVINNLCVLFQNGAFPFMFRALIIP